MGGWVGGWSKGGGGAVGGNPRMVTCELSRVVAFGLLVFFWASRQSLLGFSAVPFRPPGSPLLGFKIVGILASR